MDPRIREDDEKCEDDVTRAVNPASFLSFLRRACPRPDRGQESIPTPPTPIILA
jgi:hypothetical protein